MNGVRTSSRFANSGWVRSLNVGIIIVSPPRRKSTALASIQLKSALAIQLGSSV
jgi:hypothetical protein